MPPRTDSPIAVHRRRECDGVPIDDRRLRRAVERGVWHRVVAGSYASAAEWRALTPLDRHFVRVVEAVARARSQVVVAFSAAAAVWGMDLLGAWPDRIDVRTERRSGGRSTGHFRRRAVGLDDVDLVEWNGHFVTSAAQTAVDLSHVLGFTQGVVAVDQALWAQRPGGSLTTRRRLEVALGATVLRSGSARAADVVAFATALSDSVRESQSRVALDRMGFPPPVLQHPFVLTSGRTVRTDFWFPEHAHIGEFDGAGKYLDPALRGGLTADQVLMAEKDRGDELRRRVRGMSRWRVDALRDPRLLYDILTGDGLPASRPRPRPGQVWA